MKQWAIRIAVVIGVFAFLSACASHAPTVECDKRLAPINVGETIVPHKDAPDPTRPTS